MEMRHTMMMMVMIMMTDKTTLFPQGTQSKPRDQMALAAKCQSQWWRARPTSSSAIPILQASTTFATERRHHTASL
jgi:hypothetical protein